MKKNKKIVYIIPVILVVAVAIGFLIYKVQGKNNSSSADIKDKTLSEVKNLEENFVNIFNELNNVKFEEYTIYTSKEKQQEANSEGGNNASDSSSSKDSSDNDGADEETTGGGSKGEEKNGNSSNSKENKKYNLEENGVLTQNQDVDWNNIKKEVENIYFRLSTITLDLYQVNIDQQDIVNFNSEYDKLTKAVKEENKEDTLKELSILYDYFPKFVENCAEDDKEKILIKTKDSIFKAYSLLDNGEWATIMENVNVASQEYTKLITNKNNKNQYNVNKAYIMVNELQNAVNLKDKEIFLIKYKNLLEELKKI